MITAILSASKILTVGFQRAAFINTADQKWKTAQRLSSGKLLSKSCFGLHMIYFLPNHTLAVYNVIYITDPVTVTSLDPALNLAVKMQFGKGF